jgi:MATE family multidrug resistance protein
MSAPPALPTRDELRDLMSLAAPVVAVQVGIMLMGVVDSIMVGAISAAALAGTALGNVWFFAVAVFGMGILMAIDPLVTQGVGARDPLAIRRAVQRGLVLALLLSIPVSLLLLVTGPVLAALDQPPEVVPIAAGYVLREVPSVFPFYAFIIFRQTLQAMGRIAPIVWVAGAANLANVALNAVLIYGLLGFPALGVNGSAWATTIARWLMLLLLLYLAWRELGPTLRPWLRESVALGPIGRMVAIGAPIGAHMQLEFGVFGVVGILMGRLGTTAVAAHQIAINLASLTFMVPLGVGAAGTVLVGRAVGEGRPDRARRSARAALVVGVAFMACTAAVFLLVPRLFAAAYTRDEAVLAIAAVLIPLAGVFQVFDGLQVVSAGVLRGVADTRYPMIIGLVGFWLVGLPISLWLGFGLGQGPTGLWWGLVGGLAAVSLALLARVRARFGQDLTRVMVDVPHQQGLGEHAG